MQNHTTTLHNVVYPVVNIF